MTTSIDTNVLVAVWNSDDALNARALSALNAARDLGSLMIAAPVFAELLAAPGQEERFLDPFFADTGITIDWQLDESVWRTAGLAFQSYALRRKKHSDAAPRRILADFLIGAHALKNGYRLLTLDDRLYRAAFPGLAITAI
ncbi:MAG TPA: PIN domain-containing protein [Candidatus Acidoferrum sp.]|nr:PIN domain-containing protein [Candidatus Acidoferrum sp.]